MLQKQFIKEQLVKTLCYKCGASLEDAKIVTINTAYMALIAHAVCPNCQAQSIITITSGSSGVVPITSDLTGEEVKKFMKYKQVTIDEVLNMHKELKKEKIWKLLHKKEQN